MSDLIYSLQSFSTKLPWRWIQRGLTVVVASALSGCASVDARPDFARTAKMVQSRTGVDASYDPELVNTVEDVVATLAADGLTSDEAVQIALLNNKRMQAAFQEIGVSRADLVQAGMLPNPSVGLSVRFPEGGGRSNLGVAFAQQLADVCRIPVRRRIAEAALEQTILNAVRDASNLALEVRRNCFELAALEQLVIAAEESLTLTERSATVAQHRFDAGQVGQVDVHLARAGVVEARSRLMSLRRDRDMASIVVGHLLGLARWVGVWHLEHEVPHERLPDDDASALLIFAMGQRLDASSAALKVHAAEDEIEHQYSNIFPNVTLGVEWERPESRSQPGRKVMADTARASVANGRLTAPSIQSRGERKFERRQAIDSLLGPSLEITLPIWDQNQAQIAKARFKAVQARKEYEAILDDVARDIENARITAKSAAELVEFFEADGLPNARANVDVAQRAYNAGQVGILVIIEAQNLLITQREADIRAQRDYAAALAQLRHAVGGRFPSEVTETGPDSPTESEGEGS